MTSLAGISSMATRQILSELVADYEHESGTLVSVESIGGLDAAKRVEAGEQLDFAVLAAGAIDRLIAGGTVVGDSRVDLVHSGVAVAVTAGTRHPEIGSGEAVKQAVLDAGSVGYSTGPSGTALIELFETWGIAAQLRDRLVQARPGVPVGSLVARGEVDLGFQQLSELLDLDGVDVVGPLPDEIQITTTFSAGTCTTSTLPDAVREMTTFLASAATASTKRRHGMEPA